MKITLTILVVLLTVILKYLTYDACEYKSNINYLLLKNTIVKKILLSLLNIIKKNIKLLQ
jgi:hypothetical protein